KNFIISSVTNKYRFLDVVTQNYRLETKLMLKALDEQNFEFKPIQSRANSLEQTRDYIIHNSGLFTYLHKLDDVFGKGTSTEGLDELYEQFQKSSPNESVEKWLRKYRFLYEEQLKPWENADLENELGLERKGATSHAE